MIHCTKISSFKVKSDNAFTLLMSYRSSKFSSLVKICKMSFIYVKIFVLKQQTLFVKLIKDSSFLNDPNPESVENNTGKKLVVAATKNLLQQPNVWIKI